jgi:hypothetical protein
LFDFSEQPARTRAAIATATANGGFRGTAPEGTRAT